MIRVAFFAAFPFHTPILAPIRDAIGAAAETWLGGDRRAAVALAPHVVVMAASPHLEYFRHHLPGAHAQGGKIVLLVHKKTRFLSSQRTGSVGELRDTL